jgi:hypothetical protein
MPTLTLKEANAARASFALDLGTEVVRLLNPEGNVIAMFPKSEASEKILLPSKSPRRETIGVRIATDQLVQLDSSVQAITALRSYLGKQAAVDTTETPVPSSQSGGVAPSHLRELAIGVIIILVGAGLCILGLLELGRGFLGWALMIIGFVVGIIGLGWLYQLFQAAGRQARQTSESHTPFNPS